MEAAGLIQHDGNRQYMIKHRAVLSENPTHPTFSLNQYCHGRVFQRERQRHVLIKEHDGNCSKDLQNIKEKKERESEQQSP